MLAPIDQSTNFGLLKDANICVCVFLVQQLRGGGLNLQPLFREAMSISLS